jgi:hypothetical protein
MPVIDYTIYYDNGLSTYSELESGVATQYYTTSVPLTPDVIYTFKVTARNSVGSSLDSTTVSIRAAELPDAPINLVNVPAITTAY